MAMILRSKGWSFMFESAQKTAKHLRFVIASASEATHLCLRKKLDCRVAEFNPANASAPRNDGPMTPIPYL
jgi:hypothetical protein